MKIGDVSFYGLLPVIVFTLGACVLTMVRSLNRTNEKLHRLAGVYITVLASAFVIVASVIRWIQFDNGKLTEQDLETLNGFVRTDRLSAIATLVIAAVLLLTTLLANSYLLKRRDLPPAEFFVLLMCVCVGMISMIMANDLIAMFVALEVLSIPLYVLTAFDRRRARSLEGGFTYFILGAVSSAIFLYGIALHYGVTGSTALVSPVENTPLVSASTILILVGLLFKVAAVPFHFWSPDAYQGAPSPITMFMSAATKVAAFIAMVRIVATQTIDVTDTGIAARSILTLAIVASAIYGSIVALRQANLKRAIAYSSITHTGYILLSLKAGTELSLQAVVTYLVAYAFVIAGTFAIVSIVSGTDEQNDTLASIKGLHRTHPVLAGSFTILLFAQAGIPLTSGFIAKFDVFRAAFEQQFYLTGMIVLVATVIAAAFYLRIVLAMYSETFDDESAPTQKIESNKVSVGASIAVGICVVITIAIGVFPALLTGFTHAL